LVSASVALTVSILILWTVVLAEPYWAYWDDPYFLAASMSGSPLTALWNIHGDRFGFVGADGLSTVSLFPQYWAGIRFGAPSMYLFNAFFVLAALATFALGISRVKAFNGRLIPLAFLGGLLWPYTYEMFFFGLLQEKFLILLAALWFIWLGMSSRVRSTALFVSVIALLAIASTVSKPQFLIFLPALGLVLWLKPYDEARVRRIFASVFALAAMSVLTASAVVSDYVSGEASAGNPLENLSSRPVILVLAITVGLTGFTIMRGGFKVLSSRSAIPIYLALSMTLALVWQGAYQNYILAPYGAIAGALLATSIEQYLPGRSLLTITGLFGALVAVFAVYRLPQVLEPMHDLGEFVTSVELENIRQEDVLLFVNCGQGSLVISYYSALEGLADSNTQTYVGRGQWVDRVEPVAYVLSQSRICNEIPVPTGAPLVWKSSGKSPFELRLIN